MQDQNTRGIQEIGYRLQDTGLYYHPYDRTHRRKFVSQNFRHWPKYQRFEILCRIAVSKGNSPSTGPLLTAVNSCNAISVEMQYLKEIFPTIHGTKTRQNGGFSELVILVVKEN